MMHKKRKTRFVRTLLLGAAVTLLSSCTIFPSRATYYYALEYSAPEATTDAVELGVVRVFEPNVSAAYNRRQIVVRDGSPRFQYLTDDMWAIDLVDTLQDFIERYFHDTGTFSEIIGEFSPLPADFEIHSAIRRLEFLCCDTPEARVEIVFELRRPDGRVLVREEFRRNEELEAGDLVAFAWGANALFLEAVAEFDQRIRDDFAGQ
ncbi:MAG: hypothetical protein EA383_02950 [Spirochaetaceae bacterium]|nr:MAG: hypothetical protein EA383_02950 [Spirochaetaceae bacterium]